MHECFCSWTQSSISTQWFPRIGECSKIRKNWINLSLMQKQHVKQSCGKGRTPTCSLCSMLTSSFCSVWVIKVNKINSKTASLSCSTPTLMCLTIICVLIVFQSVDMWPHPLPWYRLLWPSSTSPQRCPRRELSRRIHWPDLHKFHKCHLTARPGYEINFSLNLSFYFCPSFPGEEYTPQELLLQKPHWSTASTNTASSSLSSKGCSPIWYHHSRFSCHLFVFITTSGKFLTFRENYFLMIPFLRVHLAFSLFIWSEISSLSLAWMYY